MAADPLLTFHGEHEAFRRALRTLERALDASVNRRHADATEMVVFHDAVHLLRTSVSSHFRREEESLLPVLEEKVGRHGTLVGIIAYDHEEIRRETGKLAEALDALETKANDRHEPELAEVNRHGIFLVQYLGLHMAKEDAYYAEAARLDLGEEGMAEVHRRLETIR